MPPPSWIGTLSPTAAIISRITFSFLGRPAMAPFRSTMCRRLAPCEAQCFAMATGSSEKTVAVLMSPCFRRTHRPSFRSIAGMMSKSRTPAHEIGEELQAGGLAFFGVELDGKNVIPCHRAGKGPAVHRRGRGEGGVLRRRIVAVHEVEPAAVADPLPYRVPMVGLGLVDFVPSHMRNLEPGNGEARHPSGQDAQARRVALVAMLEEHLQADANAKE